VARHADVTGGPPFVLQAVDSNGDSNSSDHRQTENDRRQRIALAQSVPTWDMPGLKNRRSFDGAAPPRTWPTHYERVSPRCPRLPSAANPEQRLADIAIG
jgi:hypothetical protein